MSFTETRAWIARRRQELTDERDVLDDLAPLRTQLLDATVATATSAAAGALAGLDDVVGIRQALADGITARLTAAFSAGLADPGVLPDELRSQLSSTIVLLGLALKATASVGRTLLFQALESLLTRIDDARAATGAARDAADALLVLPLAAQSLLSAETVTGVRQQLEEAQGAAQRLPAGALDPGGLAAELGFLTSSMSLAIRDLARGSTDQATKLARLDTLERAVKVLSDAVAAVIAQQAAVRAFKVTLETRGGLSSADQATISALNTGLTEITGEMAELAGADLERLRVSWQRRLAELVGIAALLSPDGIAVSAFADPAAAASYDTVLRVFDSTLALSFLMTRVQEEADALRGLYRDPTPPPTADPDPLRGALAVLLQTLDTLAAGVTVAEVPAAGVIDQLLSILAAGRISEAMEALRTGDVQRLFTLSTEGASSVARVAPELRSFVESLIGQNSNLPQRLSTAFGRVLDVERSDLAASLSTDQSRASAITDIDTELARLDELEATLKEAEGT